MEIKLYTKPDCVQCGATKRALGKNGLDYTEIDLTEDEEALATVKALGYQQAPVVVAGGEHWSGFRPDRIKALGAIAASAIKEEVYAEEVGMKELKMLDAEPGLQSNI